MPRCPSACSRGSDDVMSAEGSPIADRKHSRLVETMGGVTYMNPDSDTDDADDYEDHRGNHHDHHHHQRPSGSRPGSGSGLSRSPVWGRPAHSDDQSSQNGGAFALPATIDLTSHLKRKDMFSSRKQREFIPDNKKDDSYWDRRRRNNEAAKRSREKRRLNDMVLESRVLELTKENVFLRAQLTAIRDKYGINGETLITPEQVTAALPPPEHVAINLSKRAKLLGVASVTTPPLLMAHPQPMGGGAAAQVRRYLEAPPHDYWIHHTYGNGNVNGNGNANVNHRPPEPPTALISALTGSSLVARPNPGYSPYLFEPQSALHANGNCNDSASSISGDDERNSPPPVVIAAVMSAADQQNHLPHKLRHKSRLGNGNGNGNGYDENASATSGDEREREEEVRRGVARTAVSPLASVNGNVNSNVNGNGSDRLETENSQLKSQLERLAREVANLKDMIYDKDDVKVEQDVNGNGKTTSHLAHG